MIWNPNKLLRDVYGRYGSLEQAGLKRIGRTRDMLLLTFLDGRKEVIAPGEVIPLPKAARVDRRENRH